MFTYSTNIEDYYGKYQSINSELKVNFTYGDSGVVNLSVNEINIDSTSLWQDYSWLPNSATVLLGIRFCDNEGYRYAINLFIVKFDNKVILVTGFYMHFKENEDKIYNVENNLTDVKIQAIELSYEKL